MNKLGLAAVISMAFAITSSLVHAEGAAVAGKNKSASCAGCHGPDGNSPMPMFPKLAGQHASYTLKQLMAFKDGSRNNATMAPMAAALSQQDMLDIAAYYQSEKVSANKMPQLSADDDDEELSAQEIEAKKAKQAEELQALLAKGSDLYRNGDLVREVSACIACHGPHGEGNKPAGFPMLKGQHAEYIIKTLADFKSNSRGNNPDNMMHMIARKMTDEEIKAVAYHISVMQD